MKVISRINNNSQHQEARKKLLAALHIAKQDLGLSDKQYRDMLWASFGFPTAAALSNEDLKGVIDYFISDCGWKPKGRKAQQVKIYQIVALRERVIDFTPRLKNGKARIQGLCRKICGVDRVEWCNDANKLKRLLAAMGNIRRKEEGS
jgi:phage gp16-like protein